jgi:hypothetical protein
MRESGIVNFFTFDEDSNYYPTSSIDSFGVDRQGAEKGTSSKFKDGHTIHISRPAESVAELLGSAILHYQGCGEDGADRALHKRHVQ